MQLSLVLLVSVSVMVLAQTRLAPALPLACLALLANQGTLLPLWPFRIVRLLQ